MTTLSSRAEEAYFTNIKERAINYKNKGYAVTIAPESDQLPDFLKEFPVDLIAKNELETVVIEVKSRQGLKENLSIIDRMDEVIKAHPGWRFELILLKDEPEPLPEIDPNAILDEVENLQNSGYDNAGLLLVWGVIEVGLRRIANREGIEFKQKSFDYLLKELVSLGLIEDNIYKVLWKAMKIRNAIAHGYKPPENEAVSLDELIKIARRLL